MTLRVQWIPTDLRTPSTEPNILAAGGAVRRLQPVPEFPSPSGKPIPVRKLPELWRHVPEAANELPPVWTIGGMSIASVIGILTLGLITPGDTPLPEDNGLNQKGALDKPPAGKTIPVWLAELERSTQIARLFSEKLLSLRIQQELGNFAAVRQLELELEVLDVQRTTSQDASPLMHRPLQMMASTARLSPAHQGGGDDRVIQKLRDYVISTKDHYFDHILTEKAAQPFLDWHRGGRPVLESLYHLLARQGRLDEDQDVHYRMLAFAAMILGYIPDPRSIPVLASRLGREIDDPCLARARTTIHPAERAIMMCLWALRRFGTTARDAVPILERTLKKNGIAYWPAVRTLLHIQPDLALPRIWRVYQALPQSSDRVENLINFLDIFKEEDYSHLVYFFLSMAIMFPADAPLILPYFGKYLARSVVLLGAAPHAPELGAFRAIYKALQEASPYVPPAELDAASKGTSPGTAGQVSIPEPTLPAVQELASFLGIDYAEVADTLTKVIDGEEKTSQPLINKCALERGYKVALIQRLNALVEGGIVNAAPALKRAEGYPDFIGLEID